MTTQRTGWTTGPCAAAAAKAAAWWLCRRERVEHVTIRLPEEQSVCLPVAFVEATAEGAVAGVRKDAGDDPDVTHGATVIVALQWQAEGDVTFRAGAGVGVVTKPGLQIPPGEPAINPVPRRMIRAAIRELTDRPVVVTVAIPGGGALAEQTFNPRLGITGGLSILGTTGIVRPRCVKALREALHCALDVAHACQVTAPVLVPGNIGAKAAQQLFATTPEQITEVSNEWGWVLDQLPAYGFTALLAVGHPGKLAKLADGEWNTHSGQSRSGVAYVCQLATKLGLPITTEHTTVDGVLSSLAPAARQTLSHALADAVREAMSLRLQRALPVAVVLVNMQGAQLGASGDLTPWL